jgi:hypothetical protein
VSFNVLFIAHAPDADKQKHRSKIDTGKYRLLSVVVRDQTEAVDTAREMAHAESIDSILLCPGFTHSDVAEISAALDGRVGVTVARGDGPSNRLSAQARSREGYPGR